MKLYVSSEMQMYFFKSKIQSIYNTFWIEYNTNIYVYLCIFYDEYFFILDHVYFLLHNSFDLYQKLT